MYYVLFFPLSWRSSSCFVRIDLELLFPSESLSTHSEETQYFFNILCVVSAI